MTFNELVAQVINSTNRPDLGLVANGGDGQIPNAVFSATLNMHTREYFWRDIIAVDVVFDATAYIQTLDIIAIPRFRSIAYFRKWDPTFGSSQQDPNIMPPLSSGFSAINEQLALKYLQIIDLGEGGIFDSYGVERQDVVYAAGTTMFIKSSTSMRQGKLGYYAYPMLDIAGVGARYSSWIADNHPFAIVRQAEYTINVATGDLEAARELIRPAVPQRNDPGGPIAQEVAALRMNNIELGGR